MGTIYKGTGWGKTAVGEYDGGVIYSGTSWGKTPIGEYDDKGTIYKGTSWSKTAVGEYNNGTIYSGTSWGKTPIGEYSNGTIYSATGWERTPIGEYNSSPAGGAALLLLATELQNGSSDPTPINNSSDDGCLGGLVAIILTGIIKIIKAYFLYYFVPIQVIAATLLGYGFMLFFAIIGLPSIALVIIYVCVALMLISIPYWVILFAQKRKKRMGWGETFKYYGKWFLKGPFAYKDIMKLKNN